MFGRAPRALPGCTGTQARRWSWKTRDWTPVAVASLNPAERDTVIHAALSKPGFPVRSASPPSCPGLVQPQPRRATQGLGLQRRPRELSHAQRSEHGEDGEHRTFPAVSTVARSSPVGGLFLGYCPLAIRVVWINQRSLRNPGSDLLDTHRVAVLSDPQSDWAVSYLLTLVSGLADVRTQESISKVIDRLHSEAP